jgi:hypothetical protein
MVKMIHFVLCIFYFSKSYGKNYLSVWLTCQKSLPCTVLPVCLCTGYDGSDSSTLPHIHPQTHPNCVFLYFWRLNLLNFCPLLYHFEGILFYHLIKGKYKNRQSIET